MYRQSRNTSQWFETEKPQIKDRKLSKDIGPGKYEAAQAVAGRKTISHNYGKVPFGTCDERFKANHWTVLRPGPGQYAEKVMNITRPVALKGNKTSPRSSPAIRKSSFDTSMMENSLMSQTQTDRFINSQQNAIFKSKEERITMYKNEEKRIRSLFGNRQGLKYQIKLNDEILDPEANRSQSQHNSGGRGKLRTGLTVDETIQQLEVQAKVKANKNDLFQVHKKLILGPGEYETNVDTVKKLAPVTKFKKEHGDIEPVVRRKKEFKAIREFEGSGQPIKKTNPQIRMKTLEERTPMPVFGEQKSPATKENPIFASITERHDQTHNKLHPGPGSYEANLPNQATKSRSPCNFGSNIERNSLLNRDVLKQPFTDPTSIKGPAPDTYQKKKLNSVDKDKVSQSNIPAQNSSLMDQQQDFQVSGMSNISGKSNNGIAHYFKSSVPRDNLASVSKEQKISPGPCAYDTHIQEKLKQLNYQLSMRYHMRPFNSGVPRFDYQKDKNGGQSSSPRRDSNHNNENGNGGSPTAVDYNQMISVKDREVMEKRFAFQKTIEFHRKLGDMRPNAIFQSTLNRFEEPQTLNRGGKQSISIPAKATTRGGYTTTAPHSMGPESSQYTGIMDANDSNIFNSRLEQKKFSAVVNNNGKNMPAGFHSTSPRFNYTQTITATAKINNDLGPGYYDQEKTLDSARSAAMGNPVDRMNRTVQDGKSAIFKDTTKRESYIGKKKHMESVGPGQYLRNTGDQFCKKTYNASLPKHSKKQKQQLQ